jgi:hypothetical protein
VNIEQVKAFMATLGVFNVQYSGHGWAQASCPLAPFTHKGGKDSTPSFGIHVSDTETSNYNCFVCNSGSMSALVGTLDMYLANRPELRHRYNLAKAREILAAEESKALVLPDYEALVPSPYTEYQEWPMWWLETFPVWRMLKRSHDYVLHRNIHPDVADYFDLRYDADRDKLIAPIWDVENRLSGARGRRIELPGEVEPRTPLKHYDYSWNGVRNSHLVWFNERVMNMNGPMVIVEGQFDCMRVARYYPKVMAILSAKTTPYKMAKLSSEDEVLLMLDNDETGKAKLYGQGGDKGWIRNLMDKGVRVGVIELPEGAKDAGEAPEEWLKDTFSSLTKHG